MTISKIPWSNFLLENSLTFCKMRTKSVRAGVSRAKFRNGPTLDEAKFHIFGVISVCRSIVEKRKSGGMPEDAEVATKKKRDAVRGCWRTNEETDSEEKSISSFFQGLSLPDPCQVWSGYYLLWIHHEQALVFKMLAGVRLVICGLYGQKEGLTGDW